MVDVLGKLLNSKTAKKKKWVRKEPPKPFIVNRGKKHIVKSTNAWNAYCTHTNKKGIVLPRFKDLKKIKIKHQKRK